MNPLVVCLDKLTHIATISSKERKFVLILKSLNVSGWLEMIFTVVLCGGVVMINDVDYLEWKLIIQETKTHQIFVNRVGFHSEYQTLSHKMKYFRTQVSII